MAMDPSIILCPLTAALIADPSRVLCLDGGFATELEARGHDLTGALWSARLVLEDPAAVQSVHADFYRAGADVGISATYQASVQGFQQVLGLSEAEAIDATRQALRLACAARDEVAPEIVAAGRPRPLVAMSVGPWGATAADGSEYTGTYPAAMTAEALADFHQRRLVATLQGLDPSAWPDVLACETIPSVCEVGAVCVALEAAAREVGRPLRAWVTVSCRDGALTSSGEPFAAAVELADRCASVVAVGVNCTPPQHVLDLLTVARGLTAKHLVAYPNRGETYDAVSHAWVEGSGVGCKSTDSAQHTRMLFVNTALCVRRPSSEL